jgi:predicted ABC-type ATPase
MERLEGKRRPALLIVAGPNGSGKTSVTGRILKHEWIEGCEYINPDAIALDRFGDWNSPEAVLKAARYASERRERCLAEGRSLIFETVLSAPDKLAFVRRAKECGFFVRLFFIGTDSPLINASRVAMRVLNGGHDVPIPKIISRYDRSIENCSILASLVDRLYVYDNSVDDAFPELLFRAGDGRLIRQYTAIRDWAEIIFRAISL